MNLREGEQIDYAVYHKTGQKVPKIITGEPEAKMADEIILRERRVREDIHHSLELYAIEDSATPEELDEGILQISLLGTYLVQFAFRPHGISCCTDMNGSANCNVTYYP